MRLVTFSIADGARRAGALVDSDTTIVDLHAAQPAADLGSVLAIVEGGKNALDRAYEALKAAGSQHRVPRATARLHAPIPDLPQIRDFLCFEKHLVQGFQAARKLRAQSAPDPAAALREMEAKGVLAVPSSFYERPLWYHPNRLNVVGTETDVEWPAYSSVLDFELEFGCWIGTRGKDIAAADAKRYIAGYSIFNDISARDEQTKEMGGQLGPGKGKTFDTANVIGPCLVTADELPDPYSLEMCVRVNGEEWGRGNTRDMRWKFEDCIAHVSRSETLVPGEFLGSGTVGNGCGLEHLRFLKPGDVVELEVEKLGVIRNRIVKRSLPEQRGR